MLFCSKSKVDQKAHHLKMAYSWHISRFPTTTRWVLHRCALSASFFTRIFTPTAVYVFLYYIHPGKIPWATSRVRSVGRLCSPSRKFWYLWCRCWPSPTTKVPPMWTQPRCIAKRGANSMISLASQSENLLVFSLSSHIRRVLFLFIIL